MNFDLFVNENRQLTEYEYDKAGRRTAVIRYLDGRAIRHEYTYYDNGELHTETDALNHNTTHSINALDQRIETIHHNGTSLAYRYDGMGARTRQIDQRGIATDYRYDNLGRLWQVQPDVLIEGVRVPNTSYTYDEVGNKLTQTDANGHTTNWTYDYFGRVTSRTLPEGMAETFTYDDVQRTQTHIDFNGDTIITHYDVMGRVAQMDYRQNGESINYSYWPNDQLKTVSDQQGTTAYYYDARDRLDYQEQPDGTVLDYDYDAVGNRTQVKVMRDGAEQQVDYGYDSLNRLDHLIDSQGVTEYTYDDAGNLDTLTYPNGMVLDYDYNALNQLDLLTTRNGAGAIVQQYDYVLDATGRRDLIVDATGRTTVYDYDDLYRLTSETISDGTNGDYSASYRYDWVGNRLTSVIQGVTTAYNYDANDRLSSQGGTVYSYDNNGNLHTETLGGATTEYSYDERNQLTSMDKNGLITGFSYNHQGIRTSKSEGGVTTQYIVDENRDYAQVLQEIENGVVNVAYTYGHDLASQTRNGQTSYYLYDGLGSTRALTDSNGSILNTYDYEAFGETLNQTGTTENSYKFTGEQFDSTLDQYYLRARYYDQKVGRFTQMDTWLGKECTPITLNKYIYANSDPVRFVDPSGHFGLAEIGAALNIRGIQSTSAQASFRVTVKKIGKELACVAIEETVTNLIMQQLTGGVYILADNGAGYVGRTNDFDRRMQEHTRSGKRKVEKVLALFHMEMDRNEQRLVEQFFMDLFREANQPLTNTNNSIARNPTSRNSRNLRRMMDRLDFCD